MNTSQKCNCCIKESVCILSTEYHNDCERIENAIRSPRTEVSIKCKEFYPKSTTNIRELKGEV